MWKLILKSDLEFVKRPDDPALGSWSPATEIVTINLSAITKIASIGGNQRQRWEDITVDPENLPSDSRLMNLLISVLNHEFLHEALDEGIKQLTKEICHDYLQEGINEGVVPDGVLTEPKWAAHLEQMETIFHDAYYVKEPQH